MKLFCDKTELSESLFSVSRAVSTKSAVTALEGILLESTTNLKSSGYDLNLGIECENEAEVEETGSVVVNAKLFTDIIRSLPQGKFLLETTDVGLLIKSNTTEFNIPIFSADDFPKLPKVDNEFCFNVSQNLLKQMINTTIYAISDSETRPILTGAFFEIEKDNLKVVATDNYRLSINSCKIQNENEAKFSFIVPGKTLHEVLKSLKDSESFIKVSLSKRHIVFSVENTTIISRLIEGEYINYSRYIDIGDSYEMIVDGGAFTDAVERVSLIINEKNSQYILITFENELLKVQCRSTLGNAYDELPIENFTHRIVMGFDHRFLLDSLKACSSGKISIKVNKENTRFIVQSCQDENFIALVVPKRI